MRVLPAWRGIMTYVTAINAILYLLIGLVAAALHAKRPHRVLLTAVLTTLVGIAIAVVLASIPTYLIAAMYRHFSFRITDFEVIVLGCTQGVIIATLNLGVFHRLL